jgi:hypothetical protein
MAQQAKLNSTVDGIIPLFFFFWLNDGITPQSINQTHRYSGQDIQPDLICIVRFLIASMVKTISNLGIHSCMRK